MRPEEIRIEDYTYELPPEKIASEPAAHRHNSKLLVFKEQSITVGTYRNIADHLPRNSLIFFNDTRVINARLRFTKSTGATIEIFCLEPVVHHTRHLQDKSPSTWFCFVGGLSKWKDETLQMKSPEIFLQAKLIEKKGETCIVQFEWTPPELSFSEVIRLCGKVPLPPYIKRESGEIDEERYQTVFAESEGSVAAPTAGLHFTEQVLETLFSKNILSRYITLHVGAGTFKPVKAEIMRDHEMHAEWLQVRIEIIEELIQCKSPVTAVGTTSLRTLESLYWLGVKVRTDPDIEKLQISQWEVYKDSMIKVSKNESLSSLLAWMKKKQLENVIAHTKLLIVPGYKFRIADVLVTNFHQPQSTLLLLIAAVTGKNWKDLYNYAIDNDFRFLSYGDGSVLYIDESFKAE